MSARGAEGEAAARNRLRLWIGLIMAGVLLAGYWARPEGQDSGRAIHSSLRTTPDGVAALARAIQHFGLHTEARYTPMADADPVRGTTVLVAPLRHPTPREVSALLDRIRRGGTLVYVPHPTTRGTPLSDSLELRFQRQTAANGFENAMWDDDRLTAGLPDPSPTQRGLRVRGGSDGDEATPDGEESRTTEVSLMSMVANDSLPWSGAVRVAVGDGRVVVLADPDPLTNERVQNSPLAALALRAVLAYTDTADTVFFSEFHQGIRGQGSVAGMARHFFASSSLGRALLHLIAACVLALACAGIRFGAPVCRDTGVDQERRSPLEHVHALGDLYRRAKTSRTAALLLVQQLARSLHQPPPQTISLAVAWLERLVAAGQDRSPLAPVVEGLREDPADLKAIANGIDDYLKGSLAS